MIDLATLTGAIIVALGNEYAGLFCEQRGPLPSSSPPRATAVGEKLWRMPLGEAYDREIDSDAADVKNIGSSRSGGSIIGAQFIQRFVNDTAWAHLDIAGVAWSKKDTAITPKRRRPPSACACSSASSRTITRRSRGKRHVWGHGASFF